MNSLPVLVRREFWEHRSLWIAPLVIAGVIILLVSLGVVRVGDQMNNMLGPDFHHLDQSQSLTSEQREAVSKALEEPGMKRQLGYAFFMLMLSSAFSALMCIVVFFYLIDTLYTERRDRSILFWKSLPISDSEVVLSKVLVALVVAPFGLLLVAGATQLLAGLVWNVRFHNTVMGALIPGWDFGTWLRIQWVSFLITIAGVLWYVPIAGYLLLVSAWARGKVFLWAVLPWIALIIAEQFVHTGAEVAKFLGRRFTGFVEVMGLPNQHNFAGRDFDFDSVDAAFSHFNIWGVLGHYETWVGVAAGAALIALAIRIRRFRDDS